MTTAPHPSPRAATDLATPSTAKEYVLGTGQDELERLALQHRLWSDAAHGAWRAAEIRIGQRVLDVGCGPGFAAFDLAQLVRSGGRVVGVDESPGFIAELSAQAAGRGLPQLTGRVGDVQALASVLKGEAPFDLAYARWVLCFVKDPLAVVRGVAEMLRPGGRFVVHDYFNYRSMTMAPRRASHDKAVAATIKSWEARGGDTDIAGRLPGLMSQAGLRVERIEVHQRLARGTDTMFQWPDVWWRIYAPKLVEMGLLAQSDCDELIRDLETIAGDPTQYVVCPPVYEVIGVKT
ncbi:MAG: methyltransferase domain-containing protein [Phycisphaerales bacterium]